jgi:hypothetical protein
LPVQIRLSNWYLFNQCGGQLGNCGDPNSEPQNVPDGKKWSELSTTEKIILGAPIAVAGITVAAEIGVYALGKELVTVGRWMSSAEFKLMTTNMRLVESKLLGVTSVSFPASASSYGAAASGSVYVEFKIAADALRASGSGWAKIWGPNSIFGLRLGIKEMPRIYDPAIKAIK